MQIILLTYQNSKHRLLNKSNIFLLFVFILLKFENIYSQEVSISLFHDRKIQGITLTVQKGSYLVYDGHKIVDTLPIGTNITIVKESDYLVYRNRSKAFATDNDLVLANRGDASFFLNFTGSVEPAKNFEGWLRIKRADYFIYVINYINLDNYIAGVIEAEKGTLASEEYYKALSIIFRTNILLNLEKHKSEEFDFCDGGHCFKYKNRAGTRIIIQAAKKTTNLVLVDNYMNLIKPYYHINSGGITADGSVIGINCEYLRAVEDTFAVYGSNYKWKLLIPASEWQQYLIKKGIKSAKEKLYKEILVEQTKYRKNIFSLGNESFNLDDVRADFNWNSSYFSMSLDKSGIITVEGKGNGSGVGFSLESAFVMALKGYKYDQILNYFYKNVKITDYNSLLIFTQLEKNLQENRP